ncbi:hypothetical protein MSAN_02433300 [Mycena sanguinolenta]|uniref:Uncharacterized protein n=1 Tax=Mycena sanguinolenta TaxID=230812 RepID=A0A8H7CER7_9AGAR|nr:hypothetical protein MSAN_02433300 [Mycena sanguinolenta]
MCSFRCWQFFTQRRSRTTPLPVNSSVGDDELGRPIPEIRFRLNAAQFFTRRRSRTTPLPVNSLAGDDELGRPIPEKKFRPNTAQFFTRRRSRTTPLPVNLSAGDDKLEGLGENFRPDGGTAETANDKLILEGKPPPTCTQTAGTVTNMLVFSLKTLSTISGSIPVAGAFGGIIDALLIVVGQVQQTSANEQSFVQLAARIDRLRPIVTKMAESDPEKSKGIIEKLQKELAWMTEQLNAAKAKGKLNQFFNSTDNSAILQNHNMVLDQMIADSTFLTVHEVAKSLRDLEVGSDAEIDLCPAHIRVTELENATAQPRDHRWEYIVAVRGAAGTLVARVAKEEVPKFTWTLVSTCKSATFLGERVAWAELVSK